MIWLGPLKNFPERPRNIATPLTKARLYFYRSSTKTMSHSGVATTPGGPRVKGTPDLLAGKQFCTR